MSVSSVPSSSTAGSVSSAESLAPPPPAEQSEQIAEAVVPPPPTGIASAPTNFSKGSGSGSSTSSSAPPPGGLPTLKTIMGNSDKDTGALAELESNKLSATQNASQYGVATKQLQVINGLVNTAKGGHEAALATLATANARLAGADDDSRQSALADVDAAQKNAQGTERSYTALLATKEQLVTVQSNAGQKALESLERIKEAAKEAAAQANGSDAGPSNGPKTQASATGSNMTPAALAAAQQVAEVAIAANGVKKNDATSGAEGEGEGGGVGVSGGGTNTD